MSERDSQLSVREVAKRWGVSRWTVRRRIESGELAAHDIGGMRRPLYRIRVEDVEAFESKRKSRFEDSHVPRGS